MDQPTYTAVVVALVPPSAEEWLSLVGALCQFAYLCGRQMAIVAGPREVPYFLEPQCTLAWEAGYDDTPTH